MIYKYRKYRFGDASSKEIYLKKMIFLVYFSKFITLLFVPPKFAENGALTGGLRLQPTDLNSPHLSSLQLFKFNILLNNNIYCYLLWYEVIAIYLCIKATRLLGFWN